MWVCKSCTVENDKELAPVCFVCGAERDESLPGASSVGGGRPPGARSQSGGAAGLAAWLTSSHSGAVSGAGGRDGDPQDPSGRTQGAESPTHAPHCTFADGCSALVWKFGTSVRCPSWRAWHVAVVATTPAPHVAEHCDAARTHS